jgi:uncharacterized membrane protein
MDWIAKVIGYIVLALLAIGFYGAWKEKQPSSGATEAARPAASPAAKPLASIAAEDGSGLTICNQSVEPNFVALGILEGQSWVTHGWYRLDEQQCKTLARGIRGQTYYVHAKGVRGSVWGEKYSLCVRPGDAFTITGFDECEPRGFKTAQFTRIQVNADQGSFTYNLTGGKLSKIDSLDVGERVYVQGFLSDELATIVRIEKANDSVKVVRPADGTAKWVSVDDILTREEAEMNELGRAAAGAALIWCLFSPESCKQ